MVISLATVYRFVLKHEKEMDRYGVGALKARITTPAATRGFLENGRTVNGDIPSMTDATQTDRNILSRIKSFTYRCRHLSSREISRSTIGSISNSGRSNSRAVLYRTLAYTAAYFLSFLASYVLYVMWIVNRRSWLPFELKVFREIFFPLQGLYNFLIFLYPRVLHAKRSRGVGGTSISWWGALVKAFWSKGGCDRRSSMLRQRSNGHFGGSGRTGPRAFSRRRSSHGTHSRNQAQYLQGAMSLPQKGEEKDLEEEKCEVQQISLDDSQDSDDDHIFGMPLYERNAPSNHVQDPREDALFVMCGAQEEEDKEEGAKEEG